MEKYTIIICKNCYQTQVYKKEYYEKHKKHINCSCGNGKTLVSRKDIYSAIKNDFKITGWEKFKNESLDDYISRLKNSIDKGFDIIHTEGDE